MNNPQTFDIQPAPKRSAVTPFRSDESCFSPLADRKAPKPSCAKCGGESLGGTFTEMDSGYPLGQVTGTAEFSCGCDGKTVFSIMSDNIDQWFLFRQLSPGVFRVKKKTEQQRKKALEEQKVVQS